MTLLAEVDLTSPVSILFAGIVVAGTGLVVLWKVSRTDKDAQLAAKDAELADLRKRELTHITERASWAETQLRSAKAQEASAEAQADLADGQRAIVARLEALERRTP